jgi:glycosyltransferase involved in cell wall biosynthesis
VFTPFPVAARIASLREHPNRDRKAVNHPSEKQAAAPVLSIGIIAWNEEESIAATIESLFAQVLFAQLQQRHLRAEIICVCNGCTDNTPLIAKWLLEQRLKEHPFASIISARCVEVAEAGKINAWNLFVHRLSDDAAKVLFLMDADIVFNEPATLWNMFSALQSHPEAVVAVDRPEKDISLRGVRTLPDWISLTASRMTQAAEAQLTGQLYAIRAEIARNIYLPKDLAACEDGFIKALVCTDFLTHDVAPERILLAKNASHVFAAYTSPLDVLRNQKRQMIGQAIVHILVDDDLKELPASERLHLADTLRHRDEADPSWLKRLIAEHLRRTRHFWRLIPGIVTFRFKRLARLPVIQRIVCLPAALAGFVVNMIGCWMAYHYLKQGVTAYWPDTRSPHLQVAGARTGGASAPRH